MSVHTILATIWTNPKPSVFTVFHSIKKVFADLKQKQALICNFTSHALKIQSYNLGLIGLLSAVFFGNDISQSFVIPIIHILIFFPISFVGIKISFGAFSFHGRIVREFTFVSLFTQSLLEERTIH